MKIVEEMPGIHYGLSFVELYHTNDGIQSRVLRWADSKLFELRLGEWREITNSVRWLGYNDKPKYIVKD